jgi:hypothetical protein
VRRARRLWCSARDREVPYVLALAVSSVLLVVFTAAHVVGMVHR